MFNLYSSIHARLLTGMISQHLQVEFIDELIPRGPNDHLFLLNVRPEVLWLSRKQLSGSRYITL